jgi:hypothetical protein
LKQELPLGDDVCEEKSVMWEKVGRRKLMAGENKYSLVPKVGSMALELECPLLKNAASDE